MHLFLRDLCRQEGRVAARENGMSTLERTISMMKELPETDLLQIQDLIRKLFPDHQFEIVDHAAGNALNSLLRKDFMEETEALLIFTRYWNGVNSNIEAAEQKYVSINA